MSHVDISEKIYQKLSFIAETENTAVSVLLEDICKEYIKNYKNATSLVEENSIIRFYKSAYKDKFGLPTTETFDRESLQNVLSSLEESLGSREAAESKMQKAIAWFIYVNDNLNQENKKIPHRLKILTQQDWLLQNAIEVTAGKSLEYIIRSGKEGFDAKAFSSAAKKGDIGNNYHENLSEKAEALLIKLEQLIKDYKLPKSLKKDFAKLYESEVPDLAYIEKAKSLLIRIENKLKNE